MALKLFAVDVPFNPRLQLVEVTAAFAGVTVERVKGFMPADGETEEYRKKYHPLQRSPVLETAKGPIFESGAICRYLARLGDEKKAGLYGQCIYEASQVDQWTDFASGEIGAPAFPLFIKAKGFGNPPEEVLAEKNKELQNAFSGLDLWIGSKEFLVGQQVTLADIVVAVYVDLALTYGDAALRTQYPNVTRYYRGLLKQPNFIKGLEACGRTTGPVV